MQKMVKIILVFMFLIFSFWILDSNFCLADLLPPTSPTPTSNTVVPDIGGAGILPGPVGGVETTDNQAYFEDAWVFKTMLPNIMKWVLGFLASAAIVVIMIGGYMMLTSMGWDQTTKGKETIIYGVIGLIIIILSYAIVRIVQNFNFFI